jgi:hypothetical protein
MTAQKSKKTGAGVNKYLDLCEVVGDPCGKDEPDEKSEYDLTDPMLKKGDEPESQSQEVSQSSQGKYFFFFTFSVLQ